MIYEDMLYQEEQDRLASELLEKEADDKLRGRSFIEMVEARLTVTYSRAASERRERKKGHTSWEKTLNFRVCLNLQRESAL